MDGREAWEELVKANMGLVMSMAWRYVGRGLPYPDLVQEGSMGLMRAVDRFDHRLGYRLSTYAGWWIRQALGRAVARHGRNIRVPAHHLEQVASLRKTTLRISHELGREPTNAELAEHTGMAMRRIEALMEWVHDTISLDLPISEQEGASLLVEFIEGGVGVPPDEYVAHRLWSDRIDRALGSLDDRDRKVIRLRFGLEDGEMRSLGEIAKEVGVSRERVRQIERRTLRSLRKLMRE
jgi:RNA polymerase primary sigma factor